MNDFFTPKNHKGFKAILLSSELDEEIKDCAIAFIEPGGGGPTPDHSHPHNHLFTVISGSIEISQANERKQLHTGMSMIVRGKSPHSVWNIGTDTAKVMGISISRNSI